jgi:hypothetical protein
MQAAETDRHTGPDLIRALHSSDIPEIERLLAIPVNVNMRNHRDISPLMVAAYRGFSGTCERLIDLGADVLHSVESDQAGEPELDDAETRSLMSGDPATIRAVHRAAARARWTQWKSESSSQDPVFILEGLVNLRTQGTPQGGPLSPLLSNVLLTDLDRELECRGLSFAR